MGPDVHAGRVGIAKINSLYLPPIFETVDMTVKAVVPIRKGSQRVKDKNLRPFGDTTLLELKIGKLKEAGIFDEIIVNTDSDRAIEVAKANGVSWHRRKDYYASSQCSGSEYFQHLGNVTDADVIAYCPVTSPFVTAETISRCLGLYIASEECDCVSTVSDVKEFLWRDGAPLNYDRYNAPNSQDLPDVKALNFGFTLVSRESLVRNRNIIGDSPLFVTTSEIEAIDIDTPLDFFIAEQVYKKVFLEGMDLLEH